MGLNEERNYDRMSEEGLISERGELFGDLDVRSEETSIF
jgi:hypothetical protein